MSSSPYPASPCQVSQDQIRTPPRPYGDVDLLLMKIILGMPNLDRGRSEAAVGHVGLKAVKEESSPPWVVGTMA